MPFIIDTHCHLFAPEFDNDRDICITKAQEASIRTILLPNIDSSTILSLYNTEKKYPNICKAMIGLHPTSIKENFQDELNNIYQELLKRPFAGIGEIGMDLYWDKTYIQEQKTAFQTQINWALQFNYPVSIHCRDAFDEIFEILDSMPQLPKGVFHCFTGNEAQAQKIIQYQTFKLGIGGVITFKKSTLSELIKTIDLQHIVLETDAPYLAPHPYRGKRNEPAFIQIIAQRLAELKQTSIDSIIQTTYQNSIEVFGEI